MHGFTADDYWVGRLLFQRGLAALYLVAFLVAVNQFRALIGSGGLTPVPRYVRAVGFRRSPSVFHLYYSDTFFAGLAWAGAALSAALVLGLLEDVPWPGTVGAWLVLWALYLSIVNVGQTWYGYGWESLILEAGFLAAFTGNATVAPPLTILVLLRWLLFRLEFGAGLIKLRGDPCWRDLTCLYYHHETQPMPGPLSWFFHRLPRALHRVEVAANHGAQLVVPFLLFAPQPVAGVAAGVVILTQLWLVASGNFSWLNWVSIVLALAVVPDGFWAWALAVSVGTASGTAAGAMPWGFVVVTSVVAALVLVLSYRPAANLVARRQLMNASFDRLHLVNTYGAFGSITRVRHEIVVEGTADHQITAQTRWEAYEFKGKPGDPTRRPRQFAPYHLRLDWQMWFAALAPGYPQPWFVRFAERLLQGDTATVRLLRHNPFPDEPPAYVRARLYRYRFTDRAERRETGAWWSRTLVGGYLQPISGRSSR